MHRIVLLLYPPTFRLSYNAAGALELFIFHQYWHCHLEKKNEKINRKKMMDLLWINHKTHMLETWMMCFFIIHSHRLTFHMFSLNYPSTRIANICWTSHFRLTGREDEVITGGKCVPLSVLFLFVVRLKYELCETLTTNWRINWVFRRNVWYLISWCCVLKTHNQKFCCQNGHYT